MQDALADAGAPESALHVVTGGADVGATLTTDGRIGAVSFTGSAAVGHRIARDAAPTKVLLELGSNSALVVAADADLGAAADAIVRGGYYASGQACISGQGVIAVRSVPDVDSALRAVNETRYGLHASVFTSSLDTAFAAIDRLDVGGVVINDVPGFRSDVMPYGGVKDSGTGREGPRFAIEEL